MKSTPFPAFALLVISLVSLLACESGSTSWNEESQWVISVDTLYTIGDLETTADDQALLMHPWKAVVDSEGYLYVSDKRSMAISVYDSVGAYVTSYGTTGQGPGEFRSFSGMGISPNDEVLIFDALNRRFALIDVFDQSTTHLNFDYNSALNIQWFGEEWLYSRHTGVGDRSAKLELLSGRIIPASDGNSLELSVESQSISKHPYEEDRYIAQLLVQDDPDNLVPTPSGVLVTPTLFQGSHYHLELIDGGWEVQSIIKSPSSGPALSILQEGYQGTADLIVSTPGVGKQHAQISSHSRGTHVDDDDHLIHLLEVEKDDEAHLVLRVHSLDGLYMGEVTLEKSPLDGDGTGYVYGELVSRPFSNHIYLISLRPYPTITRIEVEVQKKELNSDTP